MNSKILTVLFIFFVAFFKLQAEQNDAVQKTKQKPFNFEEELKKHLSPKEIESIQKARKKSFNVEEELKKKQLASKEAIERRQKEMEEIEKNNRKVIDEVKRRVADEAIKGNKNYSDMVVLKNLNDRVELYSFLKDLYPKVKNLDIKIDILFLC
jgi:hypothetical protein